MDRTYWHVPRARSWHAHDELQSRVYPVGLCGRTDAVSDAVMAAVDGMVPPTEHSDRLPPTAHLCGNCSRIIAASIPLAPEAH